MAGSVTSWMAVFAAALASSCAAALPLTHARFGMLNEAFRANRQSRGQLQATQDDDLPFKVYSLQQVDHFDSLDTRLWSQRYISTAEHCPVPGSFASCKCQLLILGGEGPIDSSYLTSTMFAKYASKVQCGLWTVEHRGYGESYPTGDLTNESLSLISSQQALADAARFVTKVIRGQYGGTGIAVSVGGSYSGALAAWARLKYPGVFHAALASSAPVAATLDFSAYLDVVERSLGTAGSAECVSLAQEGVRNVSAIAATDSGRASLSALYGTCVPISSDPRDVSNFVSFVVGAFQGAVQYNSPSRAPANIATVCSTLVGATDKALALSNIVKELTPSPSGCLDASYASMIRELNNTSAGPSGAMRSWIWQSASQFGFWQTTDQKDSPWGSSLPLSFSIDMIEQAYSLSQTPWGRFSNAVNWTNTYYGGANPEEFPENIAFINGLIDPWHALSILSVPQDSGDVAIVIPSGSHCQDWFPAPEGDVEMQKAQAMILDTLTSWVSAAEFKAAAKRNA